MRVAGPNCSKTLKGEDTTAALKSAVKINAPILWGKRDKNLTRQELTHINQHLLAHIWEVLWLPELPTYLRCLKFRKDACSPPVWGLDFFCHYFAYLGHLTSQNQIRTLPGSQIGQIPMYSKEGGHQKSSPTCTGSWSPGRWLRAQSALHPDSPCLQSSLSSPGIITILNNGDERENS